MEYIKKAIEGEDYVEEEERFEGTPKEIAELLMQMPRKITFEGADEEFEKAYKDSIRTIRMGGQHE